MESESRWQNTPAALVLRLLADLMVLNFLFILCSVPVVTIGPAMSAMYAVMFQRERDAGTATVIKSFFRAFCQNFWQAMALGAVVAVIAAMAAVDFTYALTIQSGLYMVVGTVIALLALILFVMGFALQSNYRSTLRRLLENSFLMAACAPGQLLLSLAAWIVPWVLGIAVQEVLIRFGVFYLMCGFSFPVWATVKLLHPVFLKTKQEN